MSQAMPFDGLDRLLDRVCRLPVSQCRGRKHQLPLEWAGFQLRCASYSNIDDSRPPFRNATPIKQPMARQQECSYIGKNSAHQKCSIKVFILVPLTHGASTVTVVYIGAHLFIYLIHPTIANCLFRMWKANLASRVFSLTTRVRLVSRGSPR